MKQLSRADAIRLSDIRQADPKLARLPEAMLEKDVFITEAALALSALGLPGVGIIFCGGTSLSKAHQLIERMSEDVDFKLDVRDKKLSNNGRRTLLRKFRAAAVAKLNLLGYEITDEHISSKDSNNYITILLPYKTQFTNIAAIRPDVRI